MTDTAFQHIQESVNGGLFPNLVHHEKSCQSCLRPISVGQDGQDFYRINKIRLLVDPHDGHIAASTTRDDRDLNVARSS
jgi:hypothetical protein